MAQAARKDSRKADGIQKADGTQKAAGTRQCGIPLLRPF